ncbi:MAG: hypothetical protein R2725_07670 [Solirubrobacterales bacterium]
MTKWLEAHPRTRIALDSLIVPIAGMAAAATWPSLGENVESTFYAVTAQVIPVLVLAFLVEVRGQMTVSRSVLNEWKARRRTRQDELATDEEDDPKLTELREVEAMLEETVTRLGELSWVWAGVLVVSAAWGEGLSLYALASGDSSAFLLAGTVAAIGIIFKELASAALTRVREGL